MQTNLIPLYQARPEGPVAEKILRSCVHCGFCNATCPTYQVLGNELDGPRGRIYLIKKMLEGQRVGEKTRLHLDRCLSCQSCESTCPSGVDYHQLLNIGRALIDEKLPRSKKEKLKRKVILWLLTSPRAFKGLLGLGRLLRPLLPAAIREKIPAAYSSPASELVENVALNNSVVFLHEGCVQDAIAPEINRATRIVFASQGIEVRPLAAGCCGAIEFHMDEQSIARQRMRANIDEWTAMLDREPKALIVSNASGCGAFMKDYASILSGDAPYLEKARGIVSRVRDPSEIVDGVQLGSALARSSVIMQARNVAFQAPCSLQHAQQLAGRVEALLAEAGIRVSALQHAHLCCGSAGTYSIFQPEISNELKERKLADIVASKADYCVTANIGCQTHLNAGSTAELKHWLVLVAEMITEARS